jgi:hypothetical protein
MGFYEVLDRVVALLRERGRVTYRGLKREFQLDDACLEDLKDELINAQRLAVDEQAAVLVWTGTPPGAEPGNRQQAEAERRLDTVLLAVMALAPARAAGSPTGPCAMCSACTMPACKPCGTSCAFAGWRARRTARGSSGRGRTHREPPTRPWHSPSSPRTTVCHTRRRAFSCERG